MHWRQVVFSGLRSLITEHQTICLKENRSAVNRIRLKLSFNKYVRWS